jgi:hypothetical protein
MHQLLVYTNQVASAVRQPSGIIHEFEKGSHKSWRLTWIGIKSAIYYFNKWGWLFDKDRGIQNRKVLRLIKSHQYFG